MHSKASLLLVALLLCVSFVRCIQTHAFGSPDAPLRVAVVCGVGEFDDMAEVVCERWASLAHTRSPLTRLTLLTPGRPRPHSLIAEWPPLVGICSQSPGPPGKRSAVALELERALLESAPDIVIVLRIGMNAVVVPFETCDAMPLNSPELWLLANALVQQVDYSSNVGLPRVVAAPRFRVVRGSGSIGRPTHNNGSFVDYIYHTLGVPVVLSLYVYENPYALQGLLAGAADSPGGGGGGELDAGKDIFFTTNVASVAEALDGAFNVLAYPEDELYVSLCAISGVLSDEVTDLDVLYTGKKK